VSPEGETTPGEGEERSGALSGLLDVLLPFYGGAERATADQRDHLTSMAQAILSAGWRPSRPVDESVHPDWLVDDDHAAERAAHADNWEDQS
jgi:hypothetical protein